MAICGSAIILATTMMAGWGCDSSPTSPRRSGPPESVPAPEACFTVEPDRHVFTAGQSFMLDASCSENTIAATSYRWDIGDGRTESGRSIEVSFTEPGDYVIRLEVTNVGQTSTATKELRINPRPVACFTWEQISGSPPTPCTVRFDASCSTGSISEYTWFFEGGPLPPVSLPDVTRTTTEPTTVYSWGEDPECFAFRPFERLVRLTVTDESDVTDETEETLRFTFPF